MNTKAILDYLKPILEEDPDQFLVEVELLKPEIKLGELSGYYYQDYKEVIIRIAEIFGEDTHYFIYNR